MIGLEAIHLDKETATFIELKPFPITAFNNFCFEVTRSSL
jgi:hypothetical protein